MENEKVTNKREYFIDYGKALALFMIVLHHSCVEKLGCVIYILVMFFFLVSGYTYTKGKRTLKSNAIIRFKYLIIPYWIAMVFYSIFEIFRSNLLNYSNYRIAYLGLLGMLYGSGAKFPCIPYVDSFVHSIISYKKDFPGSLDIIIPTNCHLWFLLAIFCGYIIFMIYMEKFRRNRFSDIVFILLNVLIASIEALPFVFQLPYCLGRGFLASSCMMVGYILKEKRFFNSYKNHILEYIIFTISAIILFFVGASKSSFVCSVYGPYSMLGTFIVFFGGVFAIITILGLLKIFEQIAKSNLLQKMGQYSLNIYIWHMAFLTIYSLIFLKLFNISIIPDKYYMGLIPTNHIEIMLLVTILAIASSIFIPTKKITNNLSKFISNLFKI